jgi:outer membrane protein assembly factor BamD (BamD/ComL family)
MFLKKSIFLFVTFTLVLGLVFSCAKKKTVQELYSEAETAQRMGEYRRAIGAYEQVMKDYPKDERNDKAQFMIGFIYSEYLKDQGKAKEAFQKVLDDYPESDLADDAKFMIETPLDSLPSLEE